MTQPLALIHPRNLKHLSVHLQELVREQLWLQVVIGMVLGLTVGFYLSPTVGLVSETVADGIANWLALPGTIFLTLIQMIVIPLILASVVRGIAANGSVEQLRSSGLRLVLYFLATTTIAITIGLGITMLIAPGTYTPSDSFEKEVVALETEEVPATSISLANAPAAFVSVLPNNPVSAAANQEMLQIVIFSIIFGLALVSIPPAKSAPLLELLGSLQSVVMRVVGWVMHLAPYAVFGFMAQLAMQTGLEALVGIGVYVATILAGLTILMGVYCGIAFFIGGISPWRFLAAAREVQLLAFSTNSSVAVMPVTMRTAEEKLNVRPSTAQFVIPIGATVNMDGTALFQGAATLFLTQVYGLEVGLGMLLALVVTAIGASIGTPATPGVGIVILSVVLTGVGVPLEGVALIIGVDRILELFRTAVNVTGDLVASVVIDRFSPHAASHEEEFAYEQKAETMRAKSGDDVITGDIAKKKAAPVVSEQGFLGTLFGWMR